MEDGCETSLVETTFIKPSETGSIKPFTVYQAHQSERLHSEDEFAFDGVKFSKILLVVHVILLSSDTTAVRGVYNLEDGTGSIRGSLVNTTGQDAATFSDRVRQFDGGLACVMGKLSQFGHRKSLDIESIIAAGYHQAMFHVLECMKLSLTIRRPGEPPTPDAGETVVAREVARDAPRVDDSDSTTVDSGTPNEPHYSFFGLLENDEGQNVGSGQTGALSPPSPYDNHSEGSNSESPVRAASRPPTPPLAPEPDIYPALVQVADPRSVARVPTPRSPVRTAYRLPTPLPTPEPESPYSTIVQVAKPQSVARTPSPLSSFGSSLRITSYFVPHYGQQAQLRPTQLAIVSSLSQLQSNAPYGVCIADVFESVTRVTTREEFLADIEWLLEEAYIVRPLDDDRIALTPRASA